MLPLCRRRAPAIAPCAGTRRCGKDGHRRGGSVAGHNKKAWHGARPFGRFRLLRLERMRKLHGP